MSETLADIAVRAGGQQQAVLIEQPPVHRVAGVDVLGNRERHKVDGRDDRDLARAHVGFVDEPAHATPMVGVGVGIDHRRDGQALTDMLLEQLPGGADRFGGDERIEDNPTGLAAHERDVGEIEATDLINARDDFVEAVIVVELRLAQQRGMDAVEVILLVEELEPLHVPCDMTRIRLDLQFLHWGNEPLLLFVEVAGIAEGKGRFGLLQDVQRERRRRLALGMEVTGERSRRRCSCRTALQEEAASNGECCTRGRNGPKELAPGRHHILLRIELCFAVGQRPLAHGPPPPSLT